jgi:hypothetical protein
MSIKTLVARRAIAVFCEPVAFGHAPEVILVEKFASVAFFAETT